ncbi:hypothetical protein HDV00_003229 [Rhizophlyctis rosea]|nr:hypothetical protein HDV00_003229 [Rhizophlyctis rosea]
MTEESHVADYLLFRMNNSDLRNRFAEYLELPEPIDDIHEVLKHVANKKNFVIGTGTDRLGNTILSGVNTGHLFVADDEWALANTTVEETNEQGQRLDLDAAARYLLRSYRDGAFGPLTLDDCSEEALKTYFEQGPAAVYGTPTLAPRRKL